MILELHRQGDSISAIARRVELDRKTVRRYIARGLEPRNYGPRQPRISQLRAFEPYLRQRLRFRTRVRTGGAVDCGSAEGGGHGSGRVDREFAQTCRHRVRKFGCIAMGEKSGPLVACKWLVGLSIYPSPKCTLLALHPEMPQISTRRAPSSASRRSVVP